MYTVPFVDYPAHYGNLRAELEPLIDEVVFERSDFIMRGDLVEFEKNMTSFLGVKDSVGLKSCTDALILSLKVAGVGPGDEVITVSHTFIATIAAIVHCGGKPVLVDIREDDDLMDLDQVEAAITPRTKVLLPVHLNGRICDMDRLEALAKKHNLTIVEDSAQALGATYRGRKGGSFGLSGCFSFYPAKLLGAAGDGGLISTQTQAVADQMRLLRDHGRVGKDNDFAFFAYNSRLDNLQAAILNLKLRHFPGWLERRRQIAKIYTERLASLPIKLPIAPDADPIRYDVYQNYPIQTPERDALREHFVASSVETIISWRKPVHANADLKLDVKLPVTEKLCREVISLPMNTELSDAQVEHVCQALHAFFTKGGRAPYQPIKSSVAT